MKFRYRFLSPKQIQTYMQTSLTDALLGVHSGDGHLGLGTLYITAIILFNWGLKQMLYPESFLVKGETGRFQDSCIVQLYSCICLFSDISTSTIAILTSVTELLCRCFMHMVFLMAEKVEKGEGSGNRGRREKD